MADTHNDDDTAAHSSPFRGIGFLLSGAFLVLVVVLAIAAVALHSSSGTATQPGHTPVSTVPTQPQAGGGCNPTGGDQTIPTAGPQNVTWVLFHRVGVPSSATAGPLAVKGDIATCYAHNPTGALIASMQIYIRVQFADDWQPVARTLLANGPGREAWIQGFAQLGGSAALARQAEANGALQWAGFKYVTYTPQLAVIQVVMRSAQGSLAMVPITMVWQDGDWREQTQPNGTLTATYSPIDSLDGYVPWSGA